ncbi:unnamed protein product [Adineta ricciae]|uniref:Uncharacterized protein n=1 Tax=Adineta ricciae TaxID=249248 RepID=A0A815ZE02_ADIRI|nr:unnamed protein product [Adineta ricciae]
MACPIQTESKLFLPILQIDNRLFSSYNSNSITLKNLPRSFPVPIEDRDDFFSVDPKSLSNEQLNEYRKEMTQLISMEKSNLEKWKIDTNTHNHGILLAEQTIKSKSIDTHEKSIDSAFFSHYQSTNHESIGYVDPKILTLIQLQLYIKGMNEEKVYETKLTHELEKESTLRIEACILAYSLFVIDNLFVFLADETGIRHADYELNVRKGK